MMDKYENSTFIIAAVVSATVGLMLAMSARIAEGQEVITLDTNVIAQYLLTYRLLLTTHNICMF